MLSFGIILSLLVLLQGINLIVWGQPGGPASDPDQVPLDVQVDESLFTSKNPNDDFEGVEGPSYKLGESIKTVTDEESKTYFTPEIIVPEEGARVSELWEADRQRRAAALAEIVIKEDKLAQRTINEVIEQETQYYVDLLTAAEESLDKSHQSFVEVKKGARYVQSKTASNKG